jgi:RNA polymerase sigma-70 factor (ECF subfamily)
VRDDLCQEAIRLARVLAALMPDEPEALGLLALLLLTEARRGARTGPGGELVLLAAQDRSLWDRQLVAEGQELVRRCLRRNRPGPYQVQAAISAVHADAVSVERTDWHQVRALYDQLMELSPGPVVALNRAVAVAEVEGPELALAIVDGLRDRLDGLLAMHVVRAELLRELGRLDEAAAAYAGALLLADNAVERAHLESRRASLRPDA